MPQLNYKSIKKLQTLPFVEKIILYGSRARGDNTDRSDIDLAILCPKATKQDWFLVEDIVEDADTLLQIDVVRLDTLAPQSPLYLNIMREGVELKTFDETTDPDILNNFL